MTGKRLLVHGVFLTLAPIIVAWFELSIATSVLLVLLLLMWRWAVVLSGFAAPAKTPELVLSVISISHFVEKVRWCMDRLGLDYVERTSGGTLGAFYLGRTVPELRVRTGAVQSVIGNSPEILRYLWGRYSAADPQAAEFLRPTPERLELEARLDRYGVSLQVWVYHHLLADRALSLHAWGANNPATPYWQRIALRVLFPVQVFLIRRSFRITEEHYRQSVERIEALLREFDERLADNRDSLLGDRQPNYTDFAFAALSGVWLMPDGYGGGKADGVKIERAAAPADMRQQIDAWSAGFPRATRFVERLYAQHRLA